VLDLTGLDPVIHAAKRLAIMATLANTTHTNFTFLREHLGLSDSDLSKQMSALQSADYISVSKLGRGRGGNTTYRITKAGRAAYHQHRAALRSLIGD
jgi:DNA-binding transcriptional ArsR family regulator